MSSAADRRLSLDDKYPDLKYRRAIRQFAENDRNREKCLEVQLFIGGRYRFLDSQKAVIEFSTQERSLDRLKEVASFINNLQSSKSKSPEIP